jgi:hypothetical protein
MPVRPGLGSYGERQPNPKAPSRLSPAVSGTRVTALTPGGPHAVPERRPARLSLERSDYERLLMEPYPARPDPDRRAREACGTASRLAQEMTLHDVVPVIVQSQANVSRSQRSGEPILPHQRAGFSRSLRPAIERERRDNRFIDLCSRCLQSLDHNFVSSPALTGTRNCQRPDKCFHALAHLPPTFFDRCRRHLPNDVAIRRRNALSPNRHERGPMRSRRPAAHRNRAPRRHFW